MLLNAAAAIAVASDEGISDEAIIAGLEKILLALVAALRWCGEYQVTDGPAMLVDDYGHHPTEVKATIRGSPRWLAGKALGYGISAPSLQPNQRSV